MSLLNQIWDGVPFCITRRSSESFTVTGARLTIALQTQEATLKTFFEKTGTLARGSGFLARFLIAWPESTQGERLFREPLEGFPALEKLNRRILEILKQDAPMDERGRLSPKILAFSLEAKAHWIEFYNEVEMELTDGGKLYGVRDVAAKIADNAARPAALFRAFACGFDSIIDFESTSAKIENDTVRAST